MDRPVWYSRAASARFASSGLFPQWNLLGRFPIASSIPLRTERRDIAVVLAPLVLPGAHLHIIPGADILSRRVFVVDLHRSGAALLHQRILGPRVPPLLIGAVEIHAGPRLLVQMHPLLDVLLGELHIPDRDLDALDRCLRVLLGALGLGLAPVPADVLPRLCQIVWLPRQTVLVALPVSAMKIGSDRLVFALVVFCLLMLRTLHSSP